MATVQKIISLLKEKAGPKMNVIVSDVEEVFLRRHRASSAIEGFNAALRPYLQKGVTQGFLDLFRFYSNFNFTIVILIQILLLCRQIHGGTAYGSIQSPCLALRDSCSSSL